MKYRITNTRKDGVPVARGGFIFPGDGMTYLVDIPDYKLSEIRSAKNLRVEQSDETDFSDRLGRLVMGD